MFRLLISSPPVTARWQFRFAPAAGLPPLAWLARIRRRVVDIHYGASVRRDDAGFVEGTWAGPPSIDFLPDATTVFGSGMVLHGRDLVVITPSHQLEGMYHVRAGDVLLVSNSLVAVMVASRLELDPAIDYSSIFTASTDACWLLDDPAAAPAGRLVKSQLEIPTKTKSVTAQIYENLVVRPDLTTEVARKPREGAFESFADYSRRMTEALASLITNASSYEPVVSLSSGYDSTAVAAVVARVGCHRAFGFGTSRPSPHDGSVDDSGAKTARVLGLRYDLFDRLGYLSADDLPEAEFLATGMTGEDLIFKSAEPAVRRSMLLTGYWAGTQFAMSHSGDWRHITPTTTAGADLAEFRLRADFIHVPLPVFGASQEPGAPRLLDRAEMQPFRVRGHYDRPIPRRLAEEAGVPRGTFGVAKRAANILLQREGLAGMSAASLASLERFAAAEGLSLGYRRRRPFGRLERGTIKLADRLGAGRAVTGLKRRRVSLVHFEPHFGNLLLRWAVHTLRPRYAALESPPT